MRGAQRPQTAPRCAPLPPSMGAVWALRAAAAPSTQLQENTMVRLYFYCLSDVFECKLFWSGLFWIVSSTQWCVCFSVWPQQCLWGHNCWRTPCRAGQRELQHRSHQHHHGPAWRRRIRGRRRDRGRHPHQQQVWLHDRALVSYYKL